MHSEDAGDEDWRLQGQESYLAEATLVRRRYRQNPHNPSGDHDHCEFCSAKFQVAPESAHSPIGYATTDDYRWICVQCFADFRERFRWKLTPQQDA